jgi:hypothetical protein
MIMYVMFIALIFSSSETLPDSTPESMVTIHDIIHKSVDAARAAIETTATSFVSGFVYLLLDCRSTAARSGNLSPGWTSWLQASSIMQQ